MAFLDNIIWQNSWALLALPLVWFLFIAQAATRRFQPFGAFLLRLTVLVLVMAALAQPIYLSDSTPPSPPRIGGGQGGVPESGGPGQTPDFGGPGQTPDFGGPGQTPDSEIIPKVSTRLIILLDQSASLGETGRAALRAEATRLARYTTDSYILQFADQVQLISDPFTSTQPLNPNLTRLAEALDAGAAMLSAHPSGRLILLSDGLASEPLKGLTHLPHPVDVLMPTAKELATWRGGQNEVALTRLQVPEILRKGETFQIDLNIYSEQPTEVTLHLSHNGAQLAQDVVTLTAGNNPFNFETQITQLGMQTFVATLAAPDDMDGQAENNHLAAIAQVYPPPQILLVSPAPTATEKLSALLTEAGFRPTFMAASNLPNKLSQLDPYAGMVLVNVPASALRLEQMVAIQEFVRSLGRGLLVTGGRNSLSLGGYANTPLAELLPTELEAPPREERPPVALLLIIDHSGSMVEDHTGLFTKLAMAKEAAIRAMDILGPDDRVGVLMFDNGLEWVIPFQKVSNGAALLEIQQKVAAVAPGGGTRILQALHAGLPELAQQPVEAKLAVLLTDGRSFDGLEKDITYEQVVHDAIEAGVTLSTIAIGNGADVDLLSYLADIGRGRYHFAAEPDTLPALTIAESDILRGNSLQEAGEFAATVYAPHPILRDLFSQSQDSPKLTGYLAMPPKPLAEIALQTGPGDPLLAVWGYGLGRVAEWTSDTGEWGAAWLSWSEATRFWGQVVGYTLPAPDLGLLQLAATVNPDGVTTLTAQSVTPTGQTVDLAPTEANLISPQGQNNRLTLLQIAPGQYAQTVRLTESGAYHLHVTQLQAEQEITATLGFVVPYPAEFAIAPEGAGQRLLQTLADSTQGQTFKLGQTPSWITKSSATAPTAPTPYELWPYLLTIALIFWPLEIAWRRWARLRIQ